MHIRVTIRGSDGILPMEARGSYLMLFDWMFCVADDDGRGLWCWCGTVQPMHDGGGVGKLMLMQGLHHQSNVCH